MCPLSFIFMKSGNIFTSSLINFTLVISTIMMFFMLVVVFFMFYVVYSKSVVQYMGHKKSMAETYAFLFSSVSLLIMGGPSMSLLFEYSSQTSISIIVKVVGSQWYWNFEVSNLMEDPVPMYMLSLDDISVGDFYLLEVENRLFLPLGVSSQFNITSSDVLHSFSIPSLGAKVDATSGLLSVVPIYTGKLGVHYGQCSEICGMSHSYMPFCLEVVSFPSFINWILLL